jgi:hypothetical protein
MRTLLKFWVPVEKGNAAYKDGSLAATVQALVARLEPEAAYFMPDNGRRCGFMVFDMKDPSQIPQIAEDLFTRLHAEIAFTPVMDLEDLKRGLG